MEDRFRDEPPTGSNIKKAEDQNDELDATFRSPALPQFLLASALAQSLGMCQPLGWALAKDDASSTDGGNLQQQQDACAWSVGSSRDSGTSQRSPSMVTTEKKRNVTVDTSSFSLLRRPGKDGSTVSSDVEPRVIPFESDSRTSDAESTSKDSSQPLVGSEASTKSPEKVVDNDAEKELGRFYEKLLSDNESGNSSAPTRVQENKSPPPPKQNNVVFSQVEAPPIEPVVHSGREEESFQVPSVVEDVHGAVNMSAISWTDEPFRLGNNAFIAKHVGTEQDQLILYRVLSKEEAADLIESKGTFDTECPLLSQCASGDTSLAVMDLKSGTKCKRRNYDSKLSCKVKVSLCVAGCMILSIGLFVGIAVTLFNINNNVSLETGMNETHPNASIFIPSMSPTIAPSMDPVAIDPPKQDIEGTLFPSFVPSAFPLGLTDPIDSPTIVPTPNPTGNKTGALGYTSLVPAANPTLSTESTGGPEHSSLVPAANPTVSKVSTGIPTSSLPTVSSLEFMDLPAFSRDALKDDSSPQAKALAFLRQDPSLAYLPHHRKMQRFALAVLYYSTHGIAWTHNQTWLLREFRECEWGSISCGANDEIQHLKLVQLNLTGTIPRELFILTSLVELDLSLNNLTGSIPSDIARMNKLHTLNLSSNELTSTIPSGLYSLSSLENIGLAENALTGTLSSKVGILSALSELQLHKNKLNGTLPSELALMTALRGLKLDTNNFHGRIPSEFGKLTNLQSLWLSNNALSALVPSELGLLTELRRLKLFQNELRSKLPSELGRLSFLEELSLGWNSFSGFIFSEVGELKNLVELDLVANNLDGTLPTSIGNMGKLKNLWLFQNNFEGSLPTELGRLTMLEQMLLFWNLLTSSIPTEIGFLTNLKTLSLESCKLTKSIPSELGQLTKLEWLMLYDNKLTGKIKSEIGVLSNLAWLRLENNMFSGTVPTELAQLTELEYVGFQGNLLSGSIPVEFCDMISNDGLSVNVECHGVSCDCGCTCFNSFL